MDTNEHEEKVAELWRPAVVAAFGYLFSVRSAAVLGSSNVSTANTPELYPNFARARPAAPEDGRTPQNTYLLGESRYVSPNSFQFCSQETSTGRSATFALSMACSSAPATSGKTIWPPSAAERCNASTISAPMQAWLKLQECTLSSSSSQSAISWLYGG